MASKLDYDECLQLKELTGDVLNELFQPFDDSYQTIYTNDLYSWLNQESIPLSLSDRKENLVDVDSFVEGQKNNNTKTATEKDMRNVQRWLWANKQEPRLVQNIPPVHLNKLLAEMFISIRQPNGDEYEPISLECIKNSIERHMKNKGYLVSIRDRPFSKANEALTATKMHLKKQGLGRNAKASDSISKDEEQLMSEKRLMGCESAEALQFTIFYYFGKLFGLRGRDEQRKLKYGDIELKKDATGTDYLEYNERDSKTFDGSKKDDYRATKPRIFALGGANDPVAMYKEYIQHRPVEANQMNSPLYLIPKQSKYIHPDDDIWYYPRPMGAKSLGSLMKHAASSVGLTNHSVRKTFVSTLSKAGVPPTKIMLITVYETSLSLEEQKQMSSILITGAPTTQPGQRSNTPATITTNPATPMENLLPNVDSSQIENLTSSIFRGAFIQNVNLNITMKYSIYSHNLPGTCSFVYFPQCFCICVCVARPSGIESSGITRTFPRSYWLHI